MTELIFGDAGTGKTTLVAERIQADISLGQKVFLIVPEQETVSCERYMAERLPASAPLSFEVTNFTRLSDTVFRMTGGLAGKDATPAVEQVLMWRTLSELAPHLRSFHADPDANAVERMRSVMAELRGARMTPAILESAAARVSDPALADKLHDYALISATFGSLLGEDFSGASDRLDRLAEMLTRFRPLDGYKIYLDGFSGFTEQQFAVLAALMPVSDITVALTVPPEAERQLSCADVLRTVARLKTLAADHSIPVKEQRLTDAHRSSSPALAYAAPRLFTLDWARQEPYTGEPTDALRLAELSDPLEASDFIAADILRRVTEEGAHFRDFTVVCTASAYRDILDPALKKCGIPYFFAKRESILSLEAVKLIFAALSVIVGSFRREDVIAYLKCSLSGISPEDCDALDLYAEIWNLNGGDWLKDEKWTMCPDGYGTPHTRARQVYDQAWLQKVNRAREGFLPPLLHLRDAEAQRQSVSAHVRALTEFLLSLDLPDRLDERAEKLRTAGDLTRASDAERVWDIICETFDTLSSLLPDTVMNAAEFRDLLKLLFRAVHIGQIPATTDEVLIGDAATVRSGGVKHVYLLGVNDGVFPQNVGEGKSFTEQEREMLLDLGVEATDSTDLRSSRELFAFYRALTLATESVTLIWTVTDTSLKATPPADPIRRLRHLLGDGYPILRPALWQLPTYLRTEALARERLGRMRGTAIGEAARRALLDTDTETPAVPEGEAPLSNLEVSLSPEAAAAQYRGDLGLTQSRIKSYEDCPLSDFCTYVLRLFRVEKAGFRFDTVGTFVHAVLEQFLKYANTHGLELGEIGQAQQERILAAIFPEVVRQTLPEGGEEQPRIAHQLKKMREISATILGEICEEFRHTRFRPAFEELKITSSDPTAPQPYSVLAPDGRKVFIYGTIDRVDSYRDGNDVYLRVIDYKTGQKKFKASLLREEADLQLLLYMTSLWKTDSKRFLEELGVGEGGRVIPAGFHYFSSLTAAVKGITPTTPEEARKLLGEAMRRSGMYLNDEKLMEAIDDTPEHRYLPRAKELYTMEELRAMLDLAEETLQKTAADMTGGNLRPRPDQRNSHTHCAYCPYRMVCRITAHESDA